MMRDSKFWYIKIVGLFVTILVLLNFSFALAGATGLVDITCAQGDVLLDNQGRVVVKVLTDPLGKRRGFVKNLDGDFPKNVLAEPPFRCLYGSGVVGNRGFGGEITDIRTTARIAINVAMTFLGLIVVAMVIYGGFLWLTAAGSEERVTKGKHTLLWAALGAIIVSIAWTISAYILQLGRSIS